MVTIKEISAKKEITAFIRYPNELYRGNPYYVPDMIKSQVADFDRQKNPGYEYCDTKCFLAYRDGRIVGRVAAILNTAANEKFHEQKMRFWHLDFEDDGEVSAALMGAVEGWAREKGCTAVHGPLGFSDFDREGMLIEGFDRLSMFITYYNAPYYAAHMERLGYGKEIDWIEFRLSVSGEDDPRIQKLARLAEVVQKRTKLKLVSFQKKNEIRGYIKSIFELYNEVYTLFGMVPLTDRQVERYVEEFFPFVREDSACLLEDDAGKIVAFGVALPAIDAAMQKAKGRLFPFGWVHLMRALHGKNDTLDLMLIAVHPDYQGKGVNAVILYKLFQSAMRAGIKYAETGPELETNANVQSHWRYFDAEQHKRRRCYMKELS